MRTAGPCHCRATVRPSFSCFRSRCTAARFSCHPRPSSSRGGFRFLFLAPGWSKPFPTRRSSRLRIRTISMATGSAVARPSFAISPPAIPAWVDSAGKPNTQRCWCLAPMPIVMKWGSPTTFFAKSSASGSPRRSTRAAIRSPIPRIALIRRRGVAASTISRPSCGCWRPPGEETAVRRAEGQQVFTAIGCGSCHTPQLMTGPSRERAFDRQPVPLFSDLLLHDVGTGDEIPQAAALPEEIRTPALWGVRFRRPLLHDGSAPTLADAIGRHGGEAEAARRRFEAASPSAREALIAFLKSL